MPFSRSHKKMRLRISFIRGSLTSSLRKVKPSIGHVQQTFSAPSGHSWHSGFEPLLHLGVIHQASLLHRDAATVEHRKVWYAADIVAGSELRIFFRINFQHDSLPRHVRRSTRNFRSRRTTGPAPLGPEIHENRNRGIFDGFLEQHVINRLRFSHGRQWRFTNSAAASAGQILGWNAIAASAMFTGADKRHRDLPHYSMDVE